MDILGQLHQLRSQIDVALEQQTKEIRAQAIAAVDAAIANADQLLHDASASAMLSDPRLIHAEVMTIDGERKQQIAKQPYYEVTLDGVNFSGLRYIGSKPVLTERPDKIIILFYRNDKEHEVHP